LLEGHVRRFQSIQPAQGGWRAGRILFLVECCEIPLGSFGTLTTYAMFPAHFVENFARRPGESMGYIVPPLTNCFVHVGSSGDIE